MRSSTQDYSARRNEFDCQLPEDARAELLKPKRPRILGEPPALTQPVEHPQREEQGVLSPRRARILIAPPLPPQKPPRTDLSRSRSRPSIGWILAVAALAAFGIALAVSWPSPQTREKAQQESAQASRSAEEKATAAMEALRKSVPQPTPAVSAPAAAAAPRAQLVPVTVRRATLFRLPSQELGVFKWYPLPSEWGGGSVCARYMGTVERFSQIPPNPAPGDLWNVTEGNASWVYCTPLNYNHPIWIDP